METVERPWGNYTTLYNENNYKIKKIIVNPHSRLSLQTHQHRSEHWTIIKGEGVVQIGKDKINLSFNQSAFIPKETLHRIENNTDTHIELIEIQIGDYLGEDDIIRYEDDYNRS
jgi:mannose-6-phosphate isomerase-like protein (cupin superfamily)